MTLFRREGDTIGAVATELERLLARNWVFCDLAPRELRALAGVARRVGYPARRVVVSKGDRDGAIYAILRGRLKAVAPGLAQDAAFRVMGPGDVFGEIAFLDSGPRSATVTTLEPCELAVIESEVFEVFLREHHVVARRLLATLARRVRSLSERVEDRAVLDVSSRLAKAVWNLASEHGTENADGHVVELGVSQAELGALSDATRESVNKVLRDWQARGLVRHERRRLVILKPEALRAIARGAE